MIIWTLELIWSPEWLWWVPMELASPHYWNCLMEHWHLLMGLYEGIITSKYAVTTRFDQPQNFNMSNSTTNSITGLCSSEAQWPLTPNVLLSGNSKILAFSYKSYAGCPRFYSFRALFEKFSLEHSLESHHRVINSWSYCKALKNTENDKRLFKVLSFHSMAKQFGRSPWSVECYWFSHC